jgi:hypothetical protein
MKTFVIARGGVQCCTGTKDRHEANCLLKRYPCFLNVHYQRFFYSDTAASSLPVPGCGARKITHLQMRIILDFFIILFFASDLRVLKLSCLYEALFKMKPVCLNAI